MKLLLLTSSRADFGIYLPLIKRLKSDSYFNLEILAFGTHLSRFHGYTIDTILSEGIIVNHTIPSLQLGDSEEDVATAYGLTVIKFSQFWSRHKHDFDLVLVLGDRYEMAAAVVSGLPFGIKFCHFHGGETTLGAIDNVYRHSISLASSLHFVSLPDYSTKLEKLGINKRNIIVCGSLSLDNLKNLELLSIDEFYKLWSINLNEPTLLVTVHPETVNIQSNKEYSNEVLEVLKKVVNNFNIVVSMPNADTMGGLYRDSFTSLKNQFNDKVHLIENFGTQSYFTCIKYCKLMIGNTSSGIIEAASFGRYVLNLGSRQEGRLAGENVINLSFERNEIENKIKEFAGKEYTKSNPYYQGGAVDKILDNLKHIDYAKL